MSRLLHAEHIFPKSRILEGEDFLCHHCLPSEISGCLDCVYRERIKTRKSVYMLGDEVYDPVWKKYSKVITILLAIQTDKIENLPPREIYEGAWEKVIIPSWSGRYIEQFRDIAELVGKKKIKLTDSCLDLLYVLSGNTRQTLYRGEELRIWKRHSYYLDRE